ncbi:MAG: hypothetical protein GWN29_13290 [Gammaproteobacteria bacterium]|nr:hypothetical protein [Gammaproteobacteria bacterium]
MRKLTYIAIGLLSAALYAAPSAAHHSFAAVFDRDEPIEITGTVTRVEWVNPHAWFYVDVETDDGQVEEWALEMGSANHLRRRGWNRNALKVGDVVTVVGSRARDGTMTGAVRTVTLDATGESLFGGQDESR